MADLFSRAIHGRLAIAAPVRAGRRTRSDGRPVPVTENRDLGR